MPPLNHLYTANFHLSVFRPARKGGILIMPRSDKRGKEEGENEPATAFQSVGVVRFNFLLPPLRKVLFNLFCLNLPVDFSHPPK